MIIVTGGAGFIGSNIVAELNNLGITDILIVDNLNTSIKWKNLLSLSYTDYIHKSQLLSSLSSLTNVTGIIHMGACSSTTELDNDYLMENNFHYTVELIKWSLANNVRFVYASSGATYGGGEFGYSDDHTDLLKFRPLNGYGYSKHLVDLYCLRNELLSKVVGLKFFNVYGPGEYHKGDMASVIYKSFNWVKEKHAITLFKSHRPDYKDGEQKRDFVYVKDCAKIAVRLLQNPNINGIFNIGTGEARTWKDLAKGVFAAMNVEENIQFIEMPLHLRAQYQYFTKAEDKKLLATNLLDQMTRLEDGIVDYWQTLSPKNT